MADSDVYRILAEKLGYGQSPTFRPVLDVLMKPEQAEIAARLPAQAAEIAKSLGISAEQVERTVQDLYQRGIVFPTSKGWFFARDVMQLHDSTQSDPRYDNYYGDSLFKAWDAFCEAEWYEELASEGFRRGGRPGIRVVPHWGSIKGKPGILDSENMPEILKRATALTVVPCPCRRQLQACDREVVSCMQAEGAARYAIKRGTGRSLTYEEALVELERVEQAGLVHQLGNISYETSMPAVLCNCCSDCCVAWKPYSERGTLDQAWAKSRWEAEVIPELCDGCQDCVDRCNFDAIDMVRVPAAKRLKALIDPVRCYGCGACVTGCGPNAIDMKIVRPAQHIPVGR